MQTSFLELIHRYRDPMMSPRMSDKLRVSDEYDDGTQMRKVSDR